MHAESSPEAWIRDGDELHAAWMSSWARAAGHGGAPLGEDVEVLGGDVWAAL
jgi:hypothetical protein